MSITVLDLVLVFEYY